MDRSAGQVVLEAFEAFISSWVTFPALPAGQSLVLALWAIHTWFAAEWPATPYLHITSDGPGCGKTTLMQVLGALSCNAKQRPTLRAPSVVRDIEETKGRVTYFFDQVEALQAVRVTDESALLLSGYAKGGKHGVSVGTKQVEFSTYCAKCFASIGDIVADLRSRCIVIRLGFGVPSRSWTDAALTRQGEADRLLVQLRRLIGGEAAALIPAAEWTPAAPEWIPPSELQGRDREIWTALHSVALRLKLDAVTMKRFRRAMKAAIAYKRAVETRSYRDLLNAKGNGRDRVAEFAEQALRDLASVMPVADKVVTGDLWSHEAVKRMKELDPTWEVYDGSGLTNDKLAALVARFGLEPDESPLRMERGRGKKQLRGYRGTAVRAALARAASAPELVDGGDE